MLKLLELCIFMYHGRYLKEEVAVIADVRSGVNFQNNLMRYYTRAAYLDAFNPPADNLRLW